MDAFQLATNRELQRLAEENERLTSQIESLESRNRDLEAALPQIQEAQDWIKRLLTSPGGAAFVERARIRRELLPIINNLHAGRLAGEQEIAHVRLVLRAALDRICPEEHD